MIESIDLNAIKARVEAATPGPWHVGAQNDALFVTAGRAPSPSNDYPNHDADRVLIAKPFNDQSESYSADAMASADFIAHAREDVPRLIAEVERLRAEVERLSEQNDGLYQTVLIQHAETKRLEDVARRLRAALDSMERASRP